MNIREVGIFGYRSLRAIRFPVGGLTVFVGANGVGKTNLYRSLQLLQASAAGTLAREIASEGGMESALWAGKRAANKPARIKLQVGLGSETDRSGQSSFDYDVEVGVVHSIRSRHRRQAAHRRGICPGASGQGRASCLSWQQATAHRSRPQRSAHDRDR